jgi:hypothetical protein
MSGRYILTDDNQEPVLCPDLMEWGRWMQDTDRRRVALFEQGDVRVSTVFLGLDHSFGSGEPLLFETMVFGGPLDGEQDRYATRSAAQAGHDVIVARVKEAANAVS